VKQRKPTKTWERTRLQNLVRHKSGRYYARAFAGGKEVWQSLKTSHYSVAQAKLGEFLKEHRERVGDGNGEVSAKMTFGEALKIHQQNQADDVTIKSTTRHYWNQIFVALLKSWPGLADREIRRVSKPDCREWARAFRKVASSTRYNNTLSGLRHVFNVAKDAGVIYAIPAEGLERVRGRESGQHIALAHEIRAPIRQLIALDGAEHQDNGMTHNRRGLIGDIQRDWSVTVFERKRFEREGS
jgi:hypothetical protein